MGKKNKDEAPNPNGVVNRDILQRLNFLYQASTYLESISRQSDVRPKARVESSIEEVPADASGSVTSTLPTAGLPKTLLARRERHQERQHKRRVIQAADIGRGYIRAMRLIGQKTTVKMDPTVKRTLCKGCDTVLIPGLSATVRVNGSNNHRHLVTTSCLRCKSSRRIPAPPVLKPDSTPQEDAAMEVDQSGGSGPRKSKCRRGPPPRSPPLFEREGHVIFRGLVHLEPKPP